VLVTHNETSTGVTNDLEAIGHAIKSLPGERPILIADAVSSLGAIELCADAWGYDLVVAASQKAFMTPPGLSFVSVSDRAWPRIQSAGMPRFYWDLRKARSYAERGQTPFTPAVSTLFGLREGLRMMSEEGMGNVFARHRRLGSAMREGIAALGLELFADVACASNTVTPVKVPSGWSAEDLLRQMREQGVILAGGQGPLKGKIVRIAHMGFATLVNVEIILESLRSVLGCSVAK
jgi:aspartate aminotransferase-like enzyme